MLSHFCDAHHFSRMSKHVEDQSNKRKKVAPHQKRQFALCAACLRQHDFTHARVLHLHCCSVADKHWNCLVPPVFKLARRWKASAPAITGAPCRSLGSAPKWWPATTTTPLVCTPQRTLRSSTRLWTTSKPWQLLQRPASEIHVKTKMSNK